MINLRKIQLTNLASFLNNDANKITIITNLTNDNFELIHILQC